MRMDLSRDAEKPHPSLVPPRPPAFEGLLCAASHRQNAPVENADATAGSPSESDQGEGSGAHATDVVDLGNDVFMIDTRMGGYEGITASYLIKGSKPCLVETGTARSAPVVLAQLAALGIDPDDLATIVVTHIHLDHAGGVGDLAKLFPRAQVVVHERGARHLADPAKLVASAHRVFGEAMDRLFGDLLPTPAERLTVLGDKGTIDLGDGRSLAAFHNPGHASHHIGLFDTLTGDLYTGDAAGVYIPETAEVRPSTPPPDFDLVLTLNSLHRMSEANATRLLFSHYGPVTDVASTLDESEAQLHYWVESVERARGETEDLDHAIALVAERDRAGRAGFYADLGVVEKHEALSSVAANVMGVARWLDRRGGDGLAPG
jgi:glyoxylase-like metal-dependent hydrolase (beta-lactamase superfamily II)